MAPEGRIPETDELDALRESVTELIEEIALADLPPDIRRTCFTDSETCSRRWIT
jgi:hypothetical protein